MAEWSIAAVLKTVEVRASGGSNPSLSARQKKKEIPNGVSFFRLYCIVFQIAAYRLLLLSSLYALNVHAWDIVDKHGRRDRDRTEVRGNV